MSLDRIKEELADFIETIVGRRLLYAFVWPGTVTGFDLPSGEAEVLVDDERMRGSGSGDLTVKSGIAGSQLELRVDDRVRVGFEAGDPDKPYIHSFERLPGALLDRKRVAREGDEVNAGVITGTAPLGGGPVTFTYKDPQGGADVISATLDLRNTGGGAGPEIFAGTDRQRLED